MGVEPKIGGKPPKSSVSLLNHPFWGTTIFGNTQIVMMIFPLSTRFFFFGRQGSPVRKGTILTSRKYLRHVSNEQILVKLS